MKGLLKNIVLLAIVSILFSNKPGVADTIADEKSAVQEPVHLTYLKNLHREITLLNLINGIFLDSVQIRQMLTQLYEVRKSYKNMQNDLQENITLIEPALLALKKSLIANEIIPDEMKRRVHQSEKLAKEIHNRHLARLCELESNILEILSENQIYLIENFAPCTLPPENANIGQMPGSAAKGIERILEHLRKMPERQFNRRKQKLIEKHIDRIEHKLGILTDQEKEAEKARVFALFDQIRNFTDDEFIKQRQQIANELVLKKPKKSNKRKKKYELGRVGKFMLDEKLVPILEGRSD